MVVHKQTSLRQVERPLVQRDPEATLNEAITTCKDVQVLGQLMTLAKEWKADRAKEAFLRAMADFQGECPPIPKMKKVSMTKRDNTPGPSYSHAELDKIVDLIRPFKAKNGLSHEWKNDFFLERRKVYIEKANAVHEIDVPMIRVHCVVSHKDGHTKSAFMEGELDDSGSKNNIQQRGSTMTYLERYSLISAMGLVTAGTDNDGHSYTDPNRPVKEKEKPTPEKPAMSVDFYNKAFTRISLDGHDILQQCKDTYTLTEKQRHGLEGAEKMRIEKMKTI